MKALLNDETIMRMKWDDFVEKPRPNRAGKKLDAFNALFQVFSKEKSQVSMGTMVAAQAGKEEEKEAPEAVEDLTVAFEENLFLSQDEEEEEEVQQACDPATISTAEQ